MKLTIDYILSQVLTCEFDYNGTLTICTLTTKAGFKLVGTSSCLAADNYDRDASEHAAHTAALNQLWDLERYVMTKLGLTNVPGELTDASHFSVFESEDYALNERYNETALTVRVLTKTSEAVAAKPEAPGLRLATVDGLPTSWP